MDLDFLLKPPAPTEAVAVHVTAAVPNWNERSVAEKAVLMASFLERSRSALIIKTVAPAKPQADTLQVAGHVAAEVDSDSRKVSKFEQLLLKAGK